MPGLLDGTETVGIEKEVGRSFRPPGLEHPHAGADVEGDGDAGGDGMNLKDLISDVNVNEIYGHIETETLSDWVNAWQEAALATLRPVSREQVERVRGEWINTNKEVEQMCKCSKCGYPISYFWSRTPFCPNCGAPMTDEAVDMVLKRLEVPKDDQT